MRIITISGKAECGKDTSAKLLKERLEESHRGNGADTEKPEGIQR